MALFNSNEKGTDLRELTFTELQSHLTKGLKQSLPGKDAQYKLAPLGRPRADIESLDKTSVREAAVLALFYEKAGQPFLILTLRVQSEGVHSGQISFPGGKREPEDENFRETALRETQEEIGLDPKNLKVLGQLSPLYIPPSNFLVQPFVGFYRGQPNFTKQPSEVKEVISIDFNHFLKPEAVMQKEVMARELKMEVPVFFIDKHVIWGATAMMLSELKEMVLLQRP